MATITGLTAERMLEIEGASIIDGEIIDGNLILTKHDGTQVNAGPVVGPAGPAGPTGPASVGAIPGEVKLWPSETLPAIGTYGKWVWADGAYYPSADHPLAAAHISSQWRTMHGTHSDPGAGNFRVPDMRGFVPAGLDQMPAGSSMPRAGRMTRAVAIVLAQKSGKETHAITVPEMASHSHRGDGNGGAGGSVSVNVGVSVSGSISGGTDTQGLHSHPAAGGSTFVVGGMTRASPGAGTAIAVGQGSNQYTDNGGSHAHGVGGSFSGSGSGSGSGGVAVDGSNIAHENVQPTVFVPYIVYLDVV